MGAESSSLLFKDHALKGLREGEWFSHFDSTPNATTPKQWMQAVIAAGLECHGLARDAGGVAPGCDAVEYAKQIELGKPLAFG